MPYQSEASVGEEEESFEACVETSEVVLNADASELCNEVKSLLS